MVVHGDGICMSIELNIISNITLYKFYMSFE